MPYRGYKRDVQWYRGVDEVDRLDLSVVHPDQTECNPMLTQQPTIEAARLLDTPTQTDPEGLIDIHWEEITVSETVVFSGDAGLIASIPIEAVRCAAITLTELTKLVPAASVTLFPNETYNLLIDHWEDDSNIWVTLFSEESPSPLWEGDLEDIDPFW